MENLQTPSGKLTIFLGVSSGVGKTYAMLEAAYEKHSLGIDVSICKIEDDIRPEFSLFLQNMPKIISEDLDEAANCRFNINAIINRKPQVVLVDNLASRNPKGERHTSRYQDVEEILQNGIDVYTTLNIYQVESLKDIVEQITGIKVNETVPDRLLANAEIKLIDMSHEELLQRLKIGKVFLPSNTEQNYEKFFRQGNISALRELALRYTAQRVDRQLVEYMNEHHIKGPWPAGERILVCISPSPFSAQVIRTAKRIADGLKAEWCAAYVETRQRSQAHENDQLDKNLSLAEELGAEVIIINGENVADELISLAERKNITQIVIGKPLKSKMSELWGGSLVDSILKGSRGVSVYIIPGEKQKFKKKISRLQVKYVPYVLTLLFVMLITEINRFIGFDNLNIALLYLLPVLFSAVYWGRGPSILASVIGVLSFDIFFIPPVLSVTVHDLRYLLSFAIFLLVAITTGTLANRLRNQADIAHKREARTAALYALSRRIVVETDIDGILTTVINAIAETFDGEAAILLPNDSGQLKVKACSNPERIEGQIDEEAASWTFEHGKIAGVGTETWKDKESAYIPLKTEEKNVGVLVVKLNAPQRALSTEKSQLLEAFANLTALSVMSLQLSAEAQQARYLVQSEKLRTALFNSISHELRTPLASIIGAVTSLLEEGELYSQYDRTSLLLTVNEGALRMNRLVSNLLNMARLESGMMQLKREWCDLQEIIGVALRRLERILKERIIRVDIAEEIPLIRADFGLIEQVVVNMLDNAHKYSSPDTEINIEVKKVKRDICVSFKNIGVPIAESEKEKIFDKFYRITSNQHITGTGLGLSICKGIIEAHGGQIWVEMEQENVVFVFSLPIISLPPDITTERIGE